MAFDTTSRNSNLDLVQWVEDYLHTCGFATHRIASPCRTKANLWATIGPADVPGYILSAHTDVVPVDGLEWQSDPFSLHVGDELVYGRGTTDMKGFIAACLARAPAMAQAGLKRPIHLALSYGEEVGCVGARNLVAHIAGLARRPLGCFVGEPTQMQVAIGHKAKQNVRVSVRGATCHSSLAPHGVNAAIWAARLALEVERIADELCTDGRRDPLYDVPHSTAHVGVLRSGDALNIVPDVAELRFEFRTLPEECPRTMAEGVVAFAREHLEPRMRARNPDASFSFDFYSGYPGLDTDAGDPVVALSKLLAGRNGHAEVAFGTEAGLFQSAGVPTVVVGPGSITEAHRENEWIARSELDACGRFVDGLIAHCRS